MNDSSASLAPCARYRIVHETHYTYQSVVTLSQQYLHMTPRSFTHQKTESHQIVIDPVEEEGVDGIDYFGCFFSTGLRPPPAVRTRSRATC